MLTASKPFNQQVGEVFRSYPHLAIHRLFLDEQKLALLASKQTRMQTKVKAKGVNCHTC
jgi:hypothetical protein